MARFTGTFVHIVEKTYKFEIEADEAKLRAQSCIPEMLDCDGRWEERVDLVCWGEVKEITTKTNVRHDPSGEYDYLCDYKLKLIEE